jgi:nitroreductase
MDVLKAIYGRRALREFNTRPVDESVLRELIDAAIQAPSKRGQSAALVILCRAR